MRLGRWPWIFRSHRQRVIKHSLRLMSRPAGYEGQEPEWGDHMPLRSSFPSVLVITT